MMPAAGRTVSAQHKDRAVLALSILSVVFYAVGLAIIIRLGAHKGVSKSSSASCSPLTQNFSRSRAASAPSTYTTTASAATALVYPLF